MESLEARELLFKKMNGEASIHSALVRESISLLNEQRKEIECLKETVRIYKVSDELVKEQSKQVKNVFPLENTVGYGQLCDKVIEQQKEIDRLQAFIENLHVVHFVEVQREKADVERYEKALKEIERWDKMLYSSRELGNFAKKALGLPIIPLKD